MKLHLTQERAACLLGVSLRHYQYYEAGAKPIPWTVVLACQFALSNIEIALEMSKERDAAAKFKRVK